MSRRTAKVNFAASRSQSAVYSSPKRDTRSTPALSGRARATTRTKGSVAHDTNRLTGIGQFGRLSARRVSGFTKHGTGPTFGQRSFWKSR